MKQTEKSTARFSAADQETGCAVKSSADDLKIGCVIMASGLSKRFGRNKLMAEFGGMTFIERVLELTEGLFEKRTVLTRSPEIVPICEKHDVEVILHELTGRNDAVALGISGMQDMDGCLFCPCDQPLLRRSSVEELIRTFAYNDGKGIIRLCYDNHEGAPVLFSNVYFEDLKHLPEKKGGGYLAAKYPESVVRVEAADKNELWDIDTEEDYKKLITEYK